MKKENEIATTKNEIMTKENDVFEALAMAEMEEEQLSQDELLIPMLKIAQKGSSQVDSDSPDYIEGLEPGMFFSASTGTIFSTTLKIVALAYFRNVTIWEGIKGSGKYKGSISIEEFEAMEKELNLIRDGGDYVHVGAGENGADLRYRDTRNYAVILPEFPEEGLMIYPMSSTGIKPSRKWNSMNQNRRKNGKRPARCETIWELETDGFTSDSGFKYKQVASVKPVDWIDDELKSVIVSFLDFAKSLKDNEALKYSEDSHSSTPHDPEESDF